MDTAQGRISPESFERHTSSDDIRSDIERTRCEMDETIDALGERLHPRHLIDDVFGYFGGSGSGQRASQQAAHLAQRAGSTLLTKMKEHPIPSLLFGAGIAWMLYDEQQEHLRRHGGYDGARGLREHSGSFVDARTGQPYDSSYGREWTGDHSSQAADSRMAGVQQGARHMTERMSDKAHQLGDQARHMGDQARSQASALGAQAGAKASAVGASVRETTSVAAEKLGEWTHEARHGMASAGHSLSEGATRLGESASHMGRGISQTASRATSRVGENVSHGYQQSCSYLTGAAEESPVSVGVGCLALGLVAGLLLPRTRHEDELIGETRDELIHTARERGEELLERGREMAKSTAEAALEEAERQGLTPDRLAEKVAHVASEAQHCVTDTLHHEGASGGELKEKATMVAERAKEKAKEELQSKPSAGSTAGTTQTRSGDGPRSV